LSMSMAYLCFCSPLSKIGLVAEPELWMGWAWDAPCGSCWRVRMIREDAGGVGRGCWSGCLVVTRLAPLGWSPIIDDQTAEEKSD